MTRPRSFDIEADTKHVWPTPWFQGVGQAEALTSLLYAFT